MQVKLNSWVVWLAYMFQGHEVPEVLVMGKDGYHTRMPRPSSLCALFWRCVFSSLVLLFAAGVAGAATFFGGRALWRIPAKVWWVVLKSAVGGLALAGVIVLIVQVALKFKWGQKANRGLSKLDDNITKGLDNASKSVWWEMIKSAKGKVCPVVTFIKDE